MPITPAHAAAAVPLSRPLRAYGSMAALAIGSMTPDLVYFVRIGLSGRFTHTAAGLVLFCLPAGALGYAIYRMVVRPVAVDMAPEPLRRRLQPLALEPPFPVGVAAVCVSTLVGAATHVVWDAFTHRHGLGVAALPVLRTQVTLFEGYAPRLYTLAQHGSSVAGLALLSAWGWRWYRNAEPASDVPPRRMPAPLRLVLLTGLLLVPAVVGVRATGVIEQPRPRTIAHLRYRAARGVIASGRALLAGLLLAGLVGRAFDRGRPRGLGGPELEFGAEG